MLVSPWLCLFSPCLTTWISYLAIVCPAVGQSSFIHQPSKSNSFTAYRRASHITQLFRRALISLFWSQLRHHLYWITQNIQYQKEWGIFVLMGLTGISDGRKLFSPYWLRTAHKDTSRYQPEFKLLGMGEGIATWCFVSIINKSLHTDTLFWIRHEEEGIESKLWFQLSY